MNATGDLIRTERLATEFAGRPVLTGIDLAIRRGERFVIMGPSGCGKTTLLRHLAGLLPPTSGRVLVDGEDLYALSPDRLDALRLRCGFSFQAGALLGSLSVLENVALPLRENTRLDAAVIRQTARMKLEMVGLLDAADLLPASLSGGMRKRAAIARAIALDPEILFFDEPSAGLDPVTAAEIDHLMLELSRAFQMTLVVVTHDLPSASAVAERIAVLLDGGVAALGTRDEVWASREPRIRDFLDRRSRRHDARAPDLAALLEEPA